MNGCVMAIDGLCVRTRQPYLSEVKDVKSWRCRKGGFALVVLAGSDINGRFIFATADHSGTTNDIVAWETNSLYFALKEKRLHELFFIIGDEAFSCTNQLLSPYSGRGIGVWKDSFNYWLSHSRQCIERAFGMLTMRFGIFWRKFSFAFERWSLVITACVKLHNYCLDSNDQLPTNRFFEDEEVDDSWLVLDNTDPINDPLLRANTYGNRRKNIRKELQRKGKKRPPHAQFNSRA